MTQPVQTTLRALPDESGVNVLPRYSSVIDAHDAQELRRYLRSDSLFVAQSSTFAAQLERMAHFTYGSKPCKKCGGDAKSKKPGTGFVPIGKESYREALARLRREQPKRDGYRVVTPMQAAKAKLIDPKAQVLTKSQVKLFYSELPTLNCRRCPNCGGLGTVTRTTRNSGRKPITARPTGDSKKGREPTVDLNEERLAARGRVARILGRVRAASPLSALAIECYFSEPIGDTASLWHLVPPGRTLLRRRKEGSARPIDFFIETRRRNQSNPDTATTRLIEEATRAADTILADAGRLWNGAKAQ